MEQIKETLLATGKKALNSALTLVRATAEATANLLGRAAGHAVVFVKDQTGALVRTAGGKAKEVDRDHRQTLLLIAAVVSALALIASLLGLLLGKKK